MKHLVANLITGEIAQVRWPTQPPLDADGKLNKRAPDSEWVPVQKDGFLVNPDISHLQSVPRHYWKVEGNAIVEMTQVEKDALDGLEAMRAKAVQILSADARRDMDGPFDYGGKTFNLDLGMRINLIGSFQAFAQGAAFRPSVWRTTDGDFHPIGTMAEFTAFHAAAFAAAIDFGSTYELKLAEITAAKTKAQLEAVKPSRGRHN